MTTSIITASGRRKITVGDGEIKITDGYFGQSTANLTVADKEKLIAALNAEIVEPDLLAQFRDLAVGTQFTLLSDRNKARGTVPSKAVKVDADTYFSYKHNALKKAADVLTGKPGSITKN